MTAPQQGYMLIADITGYTMYLSQSELEHAQRVLQTLLELLIEHTKPPMRISNLEGDAVFSYSLQGIALQGQTFVEMIENTYVAFRRAIDLMVMNNTCKCNACANISTLDLKFFIHHGTYGIQRLGGHDELVGSDVNLIHRLHRCVGQREEIRCVNVVFHLRRTLRARHHAGHSVEHHRSAT